MQIQMAGPPSILRLILAARHIEQGVQALVETVRSPEPGARRRHGLPELGQRNANMDNQASALGRDVHRFKHDPGELVWFPQLRAGESDERSSFVPQDKLSLTFRMTGDGKRRER